MTERYLVYYETMDHDINFIALKTIYIDIDDGADAVSLIHEIVSKLASRAKVLRYTCEDDDYFPSLDAYSCC